jgi:hypothetical protein
MNKSIIGILLLLAMAMSVSADAPSAAFGGSGWAPCNIAGNYGGHAADNCFVAWDPSDNECPGTTRDANFTIGSTGDTTVRIFIDHLDGIAETMDSFEVINSTGGIVCSYEDLEPASVETWMTLECPVSFSGVQTFTIHPTATEPWSACGTWGQVAIKKIDFRYSDGGDVPEFGVIAATIAMIGAIGGIILFRRH